MKPRVLLIGVIALFILSVGLMAQGKAPSPDALYSQGLAKMSPPDQDFAQAADLFRQAADRGSIRAQRSLGELYRDGRGVTKDLIEAMKWLQKAADKGDAQAQVDLGTLHSGDKGIPRDYKAALKWFEKAASQNDPTAQLNIGIMLANGWGVKPSAVEALSWYRKSAEQGNVLAQFALGNIYDKGFREIRPNRMAAITWYTKAAQQGFAGAEPPLAALKNFTIVPPDEAATYLLTPIKRIDPPLARAARVSGSVEVEVVVDTQGTIKSYSVIYGHPLLNEAAIESVRPLRFKPYLKDGQPVEFGTVITVKYAY